MKRQHSAEPLNAPSRPSPGSIGTPTLGTTPPESAAAVPALNITSSMFSKGISPPDDATIGSPLKRQRASIYDIDEASKKLINPAGFPAPMGDILGLAEAGVAAPLKLSPSPHIDEEEL